MAVDGPLLDPDPDFESPARFDCTPILLLGQGLGERHARATEAVDTIDQAASGFGGQLAGYHNSCDFANDCMPGSVDKSEV